MTAALNSLLKDAERRLDARLEERGFKRSKRGEYVCDIGSDAGILGWLGVSPVVRSERELIEAVPYVGVQDPEVERLAAALRGRRARVSERTVGVPLSALVGGKIHESYAIAHDGQVDERAIDRMLDDVDRHGRPFMVENGDRAHLRRTIEARGEQHDVMFRLPVVLLLLEEPKAAKRSVAKAKRKYRAVTEAARAYGKTDFDYDEFAERFEAHLGGGQPLPRR